MTNIETSDFIARWRTAGFDAAAPWTATSAAPALIAKAISRLDDSFRRHGESAIHRTAEVEPGAVLKGPVIVGPRCFVSSSALLRGGVFLDEDCIVGPCVELKTTFMFSGSKAAHLNFIGDSILGSGVNVEAGAMIANYRNELDDKRIRILFEGAPLDTGVDKFGALAGDDVKIGANAVIAPGAILRPGTRVARLSLVDQKPSPN